MLEKSLIVDRLARFETLAGMAYPKPFEIAEIWHTIFLDVDSIAFNKACDWIEKHEIKWHMLPTPTTLSLGLRNTAKRYKG